MTDYSNKIADHLQFINATITIFCLAIILVMIPSDNSDVNAERELGFIVDCSNWCDSTSIRDAVVKKIRSIAELPPNSVANVPEPKVFPLTMKRSEAGQLITIKNPNTEEFIKVLMEDRFPVLFFEKELESILESNEAKPKSLSEFKRLWNAINASRCFQRGPPQQFFEPDETKKFKKSTKKITEVDEVQLDTFDIRSLRPTKDFELGFVCREYSLETNGAINGVCLPAREWPPEIGQSSGPIPGLISFSTEVHPLRLQETLLSKGQGGDKLTLGPWERTFSHLHESTKDFGDIDFETAKTMIAQAKKRDAEATKISILGLELKTDQVRNFGILVMLALQIYFLMHQWRFVSVNEGGYHTTWLGCYPFVQAFLVTAISSVILPACVGIWLTYKSFENGAFFPTLLACVLHLFICCLSLWSLWSIAELSQQFATKAQTQSKP